MSTPYKNFKIDTPYKNSTNLPGNNQNNQQGPSTMLYPSMQSGFIPFEESTPKNRNKFNQNSRNNTPYNPSYFSGNRKGNRGNNNGGNWSQNRNNNRNFQPNNYRNPNSQFFTPGGNQQDGDKDGNELNKDVIKFDNDEKPKFYNNYQQNNRRNFFNKRGGGNNRFGNFGGRNRNDSENKDISEYFHPSMLEDPWKDLIERHNAFNADNKFNNFESKQADKKESSGDEKEENESDDNGDENEDKNSALGNSSDD